MNEICDICENRGEYAGMPVHAYEGGVKAHDDCAEEIGLPESEML